MVNDDSTMDLVSISTEITTVVASYDVVSKCTPLSRVVKHLVEISLKAECLFADFTGESQISVTLFESRQRHQFGICFNTH